MNRRELCNLYQTHETVLRRIKTLTDDVRGHMLHRRLTDHAEIGRLLDQAADLIKTRMRVIDADIEAMDASQEEPA